MNPRGVQTAENFKFMGRILLCIRVRSTTIEYTTALLELKQLLYVKGYIGKSRDDGLGCANDY